VDKDACCSRCREDECRLADYHEPEYPKYKGVQEDSKSGLDKAWPYKEMEFMIAGETSSTSAKGELRWWFLIGEISCYRIN